MLELLSCEFKKIYIKNRLLLVVVLLLSVFGCITAFSSRASNQTIEKNKSQYLEYMETLEGYSNEEKELFIQEENKKFQELNNDYAYLLNDFKIGNINEQDYLKRTKELRELEHREDAFKQIENSQSIIQSSKVEKAFLYANGVELLLVPNFPFIQLLTFLIITVLIFTKENTTEMCNLLLTTIKGKRNLQAVKLVLLDISILCGFLLFTVIEFIIISTKFGLSDLSLSYVSIPYFSDGVFSLSIIDAFMLLKLMSLIGYLLFFHIIAMISVKSKNVIIPFMISIILIIFGLISNINVATKFFITGLLRPEFYLQGNVVNENGDIILNAYSKESIFTIILLAFVLIIISILYFYKINRLLYRKPLFIFVILCTFLTGCTTPSVPQEDFIYNGVNNDGLTLTNKNMYIVTNDFQKIVKDYDKEDQYDIIRDPFLVVTEDRNKVHSTFHDAKYFYYSILMEEQMVFYQMDEDTLETKQIYTIDMRITSSEFLGLFKTTNSKIVNNGFAIPGKFIIWKDYLIYELKGKLYKANLHTKKEDLIIMDIDGYLSYANGNLYYINSLSQVFSYNLVKGKGEFLNILASSIYILDKELYYSALKDDKIYKIDLLNHKVTLELDKETWLFEPSENYLYYSTKSAEAIHIYDKKSKITEKINIKNIVYFSTNKDKISIVSVDNKTHLTYCTLEINKKYNCSKEQLGKN